MKGEEERAQAGGGVKEREREREVEKEKGERQRDPFSRAYSLTPSFTSVCGVANEASELPKASPLARTSPSVLLPFYPQCHFRAVIQCERVGWTSYVSRRKTEWNANTHSFSATSKSVRLCSWLTKQQQMALNLYTQISFIHPNTITILKLKLYIYNDMIRLY